MTHRRRQTMLLGVMLGACAIGWSCTPDDGVETDVTGSSVVSPASVGETGTAPAAGFTRLGDGRAVLARRSSESDRTVVATTVGLAVSGPTAAMDRVIDRGIRRLPAFLDVSPDGLRAAVIGEGSGAPLEVWDLDTGALLLEQAVGDTMAAPLSVQFEGDSEHLLVTTAGAVERWGPNGSRTTVLQPPPSSMLGPTMTRQGSDVFVTPLLGESRSIATWRAGSDVRFINVPIEGAGSIGRIALSPDGTLLTLELVGQPAEEGLVVIDLSTDEARVVPTGGYGVSRGSWTVKSNGDLVIAAAGRLRVIDSTGQSLMDVDVSALSPVRSVLTTARPEALVTVHEDGSLITWSEVGEQLTTTSGVGPVSDVSLPAGGSVVLVGSSGLVATVDPNTGAMESQQGYMAGPVNDLAVSFDGTRLAAAYGSGVVKIIDLRSGRAVSELDHEGRNVDAVAWTGSDRAATGVSQRLRAGAFDDTLTIWDTGKQEPIERFGGEGEQVAFCLLFQNIVAFAPTGTRLASSSHDFTVTIRNTSDPDDVWTAPAHRSTIVAMGFSPDGSRLIVASDDSTVRVLDVVNRELVSEFVSPPGGYRNLVVMASGDTMAAVDATGVLSIVRLVDGVVLRTLDVPVSWESTVAESPDGRAIAVGGRESDVVLWMPDQDLVDRVAVADAIRSVTFDSSGKFIVVGTAGGAIRTVALSGG